MSPEDIRSLIAAGIQVPIVLTFTIFCIYLTRYFLKHMDDIDKRRTESAAEREKERAVNAIAREKEWRQYLSDSRDAYLNAIDKLVAQTSEDGKVIAIALDKLSGVVAAIASAFAKHDTLTVELLRHLSSSVDRAVTTKGRK